MAKLKVLGLFLPLVFACSVFANGWQIETVDADGNVGEYSSLALDSGDSPRIAYYDAGNMDLKYASIENGTWEIETVDAGINVGGYTSVAVDSSDRARVSYYDFDNTALKYAAWDGSTWQIETVDDAGTVGSYGSMALDSSGYPHISYLNAPFLGGDLKYAKEDGSGWQTEFVDTPGIVGLYTSIALDSSGYPRISYYDSGNSALKYAYWDGSQWHTESVETEGDVGSYSSLALDASDYPHVSYLNNGDGALKYARREVAGWQTESVDGDGDVGSHTSITVDSSGHAHISYFDYGYQKADLKYAYWDGTGWEVEVIDSGDKVGEYSSITLDSGGNPHISYYDRTNKDVKYAFWNNQPVAFNLLMPEDGAILSSTPTLSWEPSQDDVHQVTYDIWYSEDSEFVVHDEVNGLTDTSYSFPAGVLEEDHTYYWKVRATDGYEETWCNQPYWSFTVNDAPPGSFSLLAPEDGATVPATVTLDWEDSLRSSSPTANRTKDAYVTAEGVFAPAKTGRFDGARGTSYDVWYSKNSAFDPHQEISGLSESSYTFAESTLDAGETYYWKVRAWDGLYETWCNQDFWSFTVEGDDTDVPVTSFEAEAEKDGVALSWDCADDTVGFNLYRSVRRTDESRYQDKINGELITGTTPYSFLDVNVSGGVLYSYWLEALGAGGAADIFGPVTCEWNGLVPTAFALYQSRPNPAAGTAIIEFDIPETSNVKITIYDVTGRIISTFTDQSLPAGTYEKEISGLSAGVYVYCLEAPAFSAAKKMVITGYCSR